MYVFTNSLAENNTVAVSAFGGKASIKKCLVIPEFSASSRAKRVLLALDIRDPARVARRCLLAARGWNVQHC